MKRCRFSGKCYVQFLYRGDKDGIRKEESYIYYILSCSYSPKANQVEYFGFRLIYNRIGNREYVFIPKNKITEKTGIILLPCKNIDFKLMTQISCQDFLSYVEKCNENKDGANIIKKYIYEKM